MIDIYDRLDAILNNKAALTYYLNTPLHELKSRDDKLLSQELKELVLFDEIILLGSGVEKSNATPEQIKKAMERWDKVVKHQQKKLLGYIKELEDTIKKISANNLAGRLPGMRVDVEEKKNFYNDGPSERKYKIKPKFGSTDKPDLDKPSPNQLYTRVGYKYIELDFNIRKKLLTLLMDLNTKIDFYYKTIDAMKKDKSFDKTKIPAIQSEANSLKKLIVQVEIEIKRQEAVIESALKNLEQISDNKDILKIQRRIDGIVKTLEKAINKATDLHVLYIKKTENRQLSYDEEREYMVKKYGRADGNYKNEPRSTATEGEIYSDHLNSTRYIRKKYGDKLRIKSKEQSDAQPIHPLSIDLEREERYK